jgi:hypothetical protein
MYDMFVERKLYIYETYVKREDLMDSSVQDDHEMLKKIEENLEKCSPLFTLPSGLNPLRDAEMQTIQSFVERLQAAHIKICTVTNVVQKRPHFVHRLLAEYFTASWFSKNFGSLDIIRQRAHDADYINSIVRHTAEEKHVLIL